MKNTALWVVAGLLVIVIVLQVVLIRKMPGETKVPSLQDIDQRIMHWTMHHGATFSAKGEVSSLRSSIEARMDKIEQKLNRLPEKKD